MSTSMHTGYVLDVNCARHSLYISMGSMHTGYVLDVNCARHSLYISMGSMHTIHLVLENPVHSGMQQRRSMPDVGYAVRAWWLL